MTIDVYLIKRSTMGGADLLKQAYTDKEACALICKGFHEEFVSYSPVQKTGEEIPGNRVIVDEKVYTLDRTSFSEILVANARKKLTKEEWDAVINHAIVEHLRKDVF